MEFHRMTLGSKASVAFQLSSYVVVSLLTLFGSGLFVFLSIEGSYFIDNSISMGFCGAFSLSGLLILGIMAFYVFAPMKDKAHQAFTVDIIRMILRGILILSGVSYLALGLLTGNAFLLSYGIFLAAFEALLFLIGLLHILWIKHNPGRYGTPIGNDVAPTPDVSATVKKDGGGNPPSARR